MKELPREIYCYRCEEFHPVPYRVTKQTLSQHRDWECPSCGASVTVLFSEVNQMLPIDRKFCYPHRPRKLHDFMGSIGYRVRHSEHPRIYGALNVLLLVATFLLSLPLIYFFGIVSFFFFLVFGVVFLMFFPTYYGFWWY